MKNILLTTGMILVLSAGAANAGLLTPGDTYDIRVVPGSTGGISCYDFGNCDISGGSSKVSDNDFTALGYGSGILDGWSAVISITANSTGDGFSVNSFNQDAYINTAQGTFALFADDITNMSGTLDALGNMIFDATGRVGIGATTGLTIGAQPWNLDTAAAGDGTGTQDIWTTGTQTANAFLSNPAFSLAGVPVTGNDAVGFTGQLVAAGNMGTDWFAFEGTQYSERYELDIVNTSVVPIPAAAWLFGSGLLGLIGISRRKKAA
jgi:hypothetical protein